jgi:hypothetical protein
MQIQHAGVNIYIYIYVLHTKKLTSELFPYKTVLRWNTCRSFLWILREKVSIVLFCPGEIGSRYLCRQLSTYPQKQIYILQVLVYECLQNEYHW